MALEQFQSQHQSQTIALTPQLQQSLKILHAGQEELCEIIDQEVLENPVLEKEEVGQETTPWKGKSPPWNSGDNFNDHSQVERNVTTVGLHEFVLSQVCMETLTRRELSIFRFLVQNLRDDGYLDVNDQEILNATQGHPSEVLAALKVLQSLEPSGIGARTLEECLLIQLNQIGKGEALEAVILRKHSKLLAEGQVTKIARLENVSSDDVKDAVRTLRALNPYPGSAFSSDSAPTIIPDVIVKKVDGRFVAVVNTSWVPQVSVSPEYCDTTHSKRETSDVGYIRKRLTAAAWLIQAIGQRHETIRKISQCIVDIEQDFFTDGLDAFQPLYLRDIAERVGLHESTVSRAISNKHIQTPRGVLELKYFFTSRIETTSGAVSSRLVKELLKSIITRENKGKPLSDYALAKALNSSGIAIARRTVTKYREEIGIQKAPLRKFNACIEARGLIPSHVS